jgi:hypothetical protein
VVKARSQCTLTYIRTTKTYLELDRAVPLALWPSELRFHEQAAFVHVLGELRGPCPRDVSNLNSLDVKNPNGVRIVWVLWFPPQDDHLSRRRIAAIVLYPYNLGVQCTIQGKVILLLIVCLSRIRHLLRSFIIFVLINEDGIGLG